MQIHELDTYIGTQSDSDYMAIDDGVETFKIPITDIGKYPEMTLAEAEEGTETAPRVISPSVLNSYVAEQIALVVETNEFSTMPQTVTNENITADMVVANSILSNPSAQTGDWTVTTAAGSLTIAGNISGTTSVTLVLVKSR